MATTNGEMFLHRLKMLLLEITNHWTHNEQVLRFAVTDKELEDIKQALVDGHFHWDIESETEDSIEFRYAFAGVYVLAYNKDRW